MNLFNKKLVPSFLILLFVLCGGYTYAWFHAAEQLEGHILNEVNTLESHGYLPSYDRIEVKGFPFKLEVSLTNPSLQLPKLRLLKISSSGVMIASASIWRPTLVTFWAQDGLSFFLPGEENNEQALASIDDVIAELPLDASQSQVYTFDLKGVHINNSKIEQITGKFSIQADEQKDNLMMAAENITLHVGKTKVFQPLTIQHLAFDSTFIIPAVLEGDFSHILQSWYEQDGTIDLNKLDLTWGDIHLEANGSVALDQDLQPLASFAVEITGLDQFLHVLMQEKMIHKNLFPIIKIALSPFAESKGVEKREVYHKISISLQDRELSIAAIPIMKFDKINWDVVY